MNEEQVPEKEHKRQQLSRLASGWVKLRKLSLEKFAKKSRGSRSNLFAQIADPDNSKRMSVELLTKAATVMEFTVNPSGLWSVHDKAIQTWEWNGFDESDKQSIITMFHVIKKECGVTKPFKLTRLILPENPVYETESEQCQIEIEDRDGNVLTAYLVAENAEDFADAISTLLGTGLFAETSSQTITPYFAIQLIHGACAKPEPFPAVTNIDWNKWIFLCIEWEKRGLTPQKLAEITAITLPGKSSFPANGSTGFTKPPGDENASWCW